MTNQFDEIASGEPRELVAGNTWQWKRSDLPDDYPPSSYALSYVARLEGDAADQTINASESGGDFLVSVAHGTTAGWAAGRYLWTAFITRQSDDARVKVDEGYFNVLPDPAAADTDPRSHAQKTLAALEAVIEGRASKDVASYSINGRSLSKMSVDELISLRRYYKKEVNREKMAQRQKMGLPTGRSRAVRFLT